MLGIVVHQTSMANRPLNIHSVNCTGPPIFIAVKILPWQPAKMSPLERDQPNVE